jgi:hypothetical protein
MIAEAASQSDAESLLNHLVPNASESIEKEGEFPPFGAIVTGSGRLESIVLKDAPEWVRDATPEEVFDRVLEVIRAWPREEGVRTAAVCTDVHVVNEDLGVDSDAIRVFFEREDGEAMNVFLPYERGEDGTLTRGDLFAVETPALIHPRPESGEEAEEAGEAS